MTSIARIEGHNDDAGWKLMYVDVHFPRKFILKVPTVNATNTSRITYFHKWWSVAKNQSSRKLARPYAGYFYFGRKTMVAYHTDLNFCQKVLFSCKIQVRHFWLILLLNFQFFDQIFLCVCFLAKNDRLVSHETDTLGMGNPIAKHALLPA